MLKSLICLTIFLTYSIAVAFHICPAINLRKLTSSTFVSTYQQVATFTRGSTHRQTLFASIRVTEEKRLKGTLVLDDFDDIVKALSIFRDLFGDFLIPVTFEVPAEQPWPIELHGLRLGKRLERLLTSSDFFEKHTDMVDRLVNIGFEPTIDQLLDEWALAYMGLTKFKEIYGNLRIPSRFVAPSSNQWPKQIWNQKLGVKVAAIRSTSAFVRGFPERRGLLDSIGFEWKASTKKEPFVEDKEEDFDTFLDSLMWYKEVIDSELKIPPDFIIPFDAKLEKIRGFNLGEAVLDTINLDRYILGKESRVGILNKIGFPWQLFDFSLPEDSIVSALTLFQELYNSFQVTPTYMIPSSTPWPPLVWGMKLGQIVLLIRTREAFVANNAQRREALSKIGFDLTTPSVDLRSFKPSKKRETVILSSDHPVEEVEMTEQEMASSFLKYNRYVHGHSSKFEDYEKPVFEGAPLSVFESDPSFLNGHMQMDRGEYMATRIFEFMDRAKTGEFPGYSVNDFRWGPPERTLEQFQDIINPTLNQEQKEFSQKLGYRMLEFGTFNWDQFCEALEIYKSIYGHVDVPSDYEIYPHNEDFHHYESKGLKGLLLGADVSHIRCGNYDGFDDPERRAYLDNLGFVWGDPSKYLRFRFLPCYYALLYYFEMHDNLMWDPTYVIPAADSWPTWMQLMPLGRWVELIRFQKPLLETDYPTYIEFLNDIDFEWFSLQQHRMDTADEHFGEWLLDAIRSHATKPKEEVRNALKLQNLS